MTFSQKPNRNTKDQNTIKRRPSAFLLIFIICLPAQAKYFSNDTNIQEKLSIYGQKTNFCELLLKNILKKKKNHKFNTPVVYVNTNIQVTNTEIEKIQHLFQKSHLIILDGTVSSQNAISTLSSTIGGVGLFSPIIMIHKQRNGFPEYKHIALKKKTPDLKSAIEPFDENSLKTLADEAYQLLLNWQKEFKTEHTVRSKAIYWRPEVSIPVELRHIGQPCMVGHKFESRFGHTPKWTEGKIDACNQSASLSLTYTIDMIRSIATGSSGTVDAKYLRITVDPETKGGAGWYLVDQPTHKHTWFESWTNRETWFGPIADNYQIMIQPFDPDVRLHHSIPHNSPKQSQITERSAIQIGVMGQMLLDFSAPEADIEEEADDTESIESSLYETPDDQDSDDVFYTPPEEPESEDEGFESAMGTSHDINPEHALYNLSDDSKIEYLHAITDQNHIRRLYETWTEIINTSNLSDEQKARFIIKILLDINDNITHANRDLVISNINFWTVGATPHNSALILARYAENPWQFTKFSKPELFFRPNIFLQRSFQHRKKKRSAIPITSSTNYKSERSIRYKNNEYRLINQSKTGTRDYASWTWTRDFKHNSQHWRNHITCPLWCQDWFFNDNMFSQSAYAGFTPGFSATFMVPSKKRTPSSFKFSAIVKPVALGGRVQYRFLFQEYAYWDQSGSELSFSELLTVNWGSTVFNPEAPIKLKVRNKNLCLNIREDNMKEGGQVNLYECRHSLNQLWGYDDQHRIKSQHSRDLCLTRSDQHSVTMHTCDNTNKQLWYFNYDQVSDGSGCFLFSKDFHSLQVNCNIRSKTQWNFQLYPSHLNNAIAIQGV